MTGRSISALILVACACLFYVSIISADLAENSDEITLEWEKILVNIENGPTFGVMVDSNETVDKLMLDLYEATPLQWLIATVDGHTRLNGDEKLSDFIRAGTTLTLLAPPETQEARDTTNFTVRTREGRELPVATQLTNSLSSLRDNITQWTGIERAQQRLLYRGKELKDNLELMDYAIYNGSILDLGAPLEECRQVVTIFVKTLSGATLEVGANLADTVNGLKGRIWERAGVPPGVQRLSVNDRQIAGDNYLCDFGLEAGSTVNMMLFSSRIKGLDQVARLREPHVALNHQDPHGAPIFREAEDAAERVRGGRRPAASIYKDRRNWVIGNNRHDLKLFDPVARLGPNPDDENWIRQYDRALEAAASPEGNYFEHRAAGINRGRIKLSSAVRQYRLAANITSASYSRQHPGIDLSGGHTDYVNRKQPVPLGADVNNWAPDAFTDSDLMRLFEVGERMRRVLARAAQTGEGILDIANQRRINRAVLLTYLVALGGYTPPVEYDQPKEDEICGICHDDLTAEPAVKPACGHTYHADCIQTWAADLIRQQREPTCPLCRQMFMLPFENLGKAELEKPELQVYLDE